MFSADLEGHAPSWPCLACYLAGIETPRTRRSASPPFVAAVGRFVWLRQWAALGFIRRATKAAALSKLLPPQRRCVSVVPASPFRSAFIKADETFSPDCCFGSGAGVSGGLG